jgi:hypothetical protein
MHDFSDHGRWYTFTIYQQLEVPEASSWAAPANAGCTCTRSVKADATDRPSQYKSRLPGLCPPAKLGGTPCWAQPSSHRPHILAMTTAKGGETAIFTTHRVLYPHQQRRKRLAPNLHSIIPFSLEPSVAGAVTQGGWEPWKIQRRKIKKNAFFYFCHFKIIL